VNPAIGACPRHSVAAAPEGLRAMIHVFNGCREICALPGRACTACGECCRQINCQPIQECCSALGQGCSRFTEKPLSSFVVIAWLMSGFEIYQCALALDPKVTDRCRFVADGASVGLENWLYVQIGFSVMNIIFALWFQHQVWEAILNISRSGASLARNNPHHIDKTVVQSAFKHVFLHDLGVLFYFFILLASFGWSWKGSTWIHQSSSGCDPDGVEGYAYWMGFLFFWVAFFFSLFWYSCSCCAGSVTLKDPLPAYGPAPPGAP